MEKLEFIAMLGEGGRDIGRMLEVRRVKGRGEAFVGIWVGGRSEVCLFRSGALTLSGPEHGEAEIDSGFRSDSWPGGSDRVGKGRYKCTEESRGEGEA